MVLVHEFGESPSSKDIISDSAMAYANSKGIPLRARFSTRKRETAERSAFDIRPFKYSGQFTWLSDSALMPLTIQDKLFIFAHANDTEVGFTHARLLASMLYANGLRAVGLITFKACNVGSGTSLEDFVAALNSRGVTVGWAKGYKGSAATVRLIFEDGSDAGWGERIGLEQSVTLPDSTQETQKRVLEGDARFKIVRSANNPFAGSFGRYA